MFDSNLMKLPGMKGIMGALVVLTLLQAIATLAQIILLSDVLASLWSGIAFEEEIPELIAFFACFAGTRFVEFAQEMMLDRYSLKQAQSMRKILLESVFNARSMLSLKVGAGRVATAATDGIDEIQNYIRIIPPKIIGIAALSLPLLVAAFFIDWISGVILAVMLPVIVFFMILIGRQAQSRAQSKYEAYTRLSNRFMDTLRGLPVLKAFGAIVVEGKSVYKFSERLRRETIKTLSTATLSSAVLDLCATFGVAAVSMMLAFRLLDGSIDLYTGIASLMLSPEYFKPIRAFAGDFHASLDGRNALAEIFVLKEAALASEAANSVLGDEIEWEASSSLKLSGISFAYDESTSGIEDASFEVHGFEHIAIIGASGSGKTTLANVLSGFSLPKSGSVVVNGKLVDLTSPEWKKLVRYIPQHPYIYRATLRDNVRFYAHNASDEEVLHVIEEVGLGAFVESLPLGLDTLVGEGARGLSGGQAHRLALARVLLDKSARILVFDEPTAHLDIETELELKPHMLKAMQGKLVFFATHRMHWMSNMDRVFVIEDGNLKELLSGAESGRDLEHQTVRWNSNNATTNSSDCNNEPLIIQAEGQEIAFKVSSDSEVQTSECIVELTTDEGKGAQKLPAWLSSPISRYKRSVVVALALGCITAACAALLMFTSGYLISATAVPGMTLFAIMVPIAFVQVFGLGRPFARYAERLVSHNWVLKITSDLRLYLYNSISTRVDDPVRARATGEYLGLLSDDVGHLQNLYLRVAFPVAIGVLFSIAACIVFGLFDWKFAFAMLACFALVAAGIPFIAYKITSRATNKAKRARADEHVSIVDDVMGAVDWVLSRRGNEAILKHSKNDERIRLLEISARTSKNSLTLVSSVLLGAMVCLVTIWASIRFGVSGTPNWIAAFTLGLFPLMEPILLLPDACASASIHADSVGRLGEYFEIENGSATDTSQCDSLKTYEQKQAINDKRASEVNAIELENVSYEYPLTENNVLNSISLSFEQKRSVAILGRSGAGKSTIADIMRGVLQPTQGTLKVFGKQPLEGEYGLNRGVGYLGQTPYLFNRTLRENLTLGVSEISDKRLIEILRSIGLGAKYDSLENGLDTVVGETGIGFSGGEEHRLALARILVAETPIIIVDEPFSALDTENERALLDTLLDCCAEKTLIVITHHLAGIERFDRVIFLEDGVVVLDDAPLTLLYSSAHFRELIESDRDWIRS